MIKLLVFLVMSFNAVVTCNFNECSCTASCDKENSPQQHTPSLQLSPTYIPKSCTEIKNLWPDNISGYYYISNDIGHAMIVYCQMGLLCGSDGPWTRVAYLDMSDPREECPGKLREYGDNGVRVCGRPVSTTGSCSSVYFDVPAEPYSKVCGHVTGYQYYSPSAVDDQGHRSSIDTYYVDGVSLTRGSPRQHIWTFMTGLADKDVPQRYACPCSSKTSQTPPSFVGQNYFCEGGASTYGWTKTLHTSDPLWDGRSCGPSEAQCCDAPGIPWFNETLTQPSSDFLELRVCCDEDTDNEDAPIGYYEIYVQ